MSAASLVARFLHAMLWHQSACTLCPAHMQAYAKGLPDAPELADITAVDLSGRADMDVDGKVVTETRCGGPGWGTHLATCRLS